MTPALNEVVAVKGRFHRSVQLERDWATGQHLAGYLLTPNAQGLAARILDGLWQPMGPKAWSLVGPYGSGKSSFALFLADVLASSKAQTDAGRRLQAGRSRDALPLFPLLLVGQRASLRQSVWDALTQALTERAPRLLTLLEGADLLNLADTLERVASGLGKQGFGGLLLVLDEFGKFLEYAALQQEHDELFLMQQLAELAERSLTPMLVMTILHTSFADYLGREEGVARTEWQKVQGRFSDVRFHEPPEQFLKLIGNALEVDPEVQQRYARLLLGISDHPALTEASRRVSGLSALLERCLPLDPLTALLLWPLFRSKMAQNERSLFGFLTSGEPGGLAEFLREQDSTAETLPLYRLDALYDYVVQSLGSAVHGHDLAVRWSVISEACERVPIDAPSRALAVVKAIGLLSSYGGEVGLRASEATLQLAFSDVQGVVAALEYLKRRSIVVYRSYDGSYALWDGSDVDLELEFDRARGRRVEFSPAASLLRHAAVQPLLARAHYIKTGTLRSFMVRVLDADRAHEAMREASDSAEATLTFVLCRQTPERVLLMEAAQVHGRANPLQIWAFPETLAGLDAALLELDTWERVRDEVAALAGDPVARRELEGRLRRAQEQLERVIGRVLGLPGHRFDPAASVWVQGGDRQPERNARSWVAWLSAMFDQAYPKSPALHNELLNRNALSTQSVKARRTLIEAMLSHPADLELGIQGNPPERSMYLGLLAKGGFHTSGKLGWHFTPPNKSWKAVWQAMEAFLKGTHSGRRSIIELFTTLKLPPFGLREGPLPILLTALLLVHRETVALFDDGLFVTELRIEVLERLMRRPELFEIQQFPFDPEHVATLHQAREALEQFQGHPLTGGDALSGLLAVVKPLILAVAQLPPYGRHTRQLQPSYAEALRELLSRATDPGELIFGRLAALHAETALEGQSLAPWLLAGLLGLHHAYPLLLNAIELQVRQHLRLSGTSAEVVEQLRSRALPLLNLSADPALTLLVRQAAQPSALDWREALGRVIHSGKPPRDWRDPDVAQFPLRLERLAQEFQRLEELVAARGVQSDTRVLRIDTLGDTMQTSLMVLSLSEGQRSEAQKLSQDLLNWLEDGSPTDPQVRLASVAELARTLIERQTP